MEGCLTIRGSSARDITFLHGLVKINCTENRPAVIIEDNPKLETIDIAVGLVFEYFLLYIFSLKLKCFG